MLRRFFILNKRLIKKPGFIAILLLVPILVVSLAILSNKDESGILTVALATEDRDDKISNEIVSDLLDEHGLVYFIRADSPEEAYELVQSGQADSAWIFPDEMEKKIEKFVKFPSDRNAFVLVVQREDNIFLRISHEKLNTALYPYLSLSLCENYIYREIMSPDDISSEEIKKYYDSINAEGEDLFLFVYANSEKADTEKTNYLLSPMRGLLSIMVVLGGFAVSMFYLQDESKGTFDRMPRGRRFLFSVGYHTVAVADVAIAALIALLISGLATSLLSEILSLVLYVIITVGFCMGLRLLCKDIRLIGALAPALTVVMAVLCPVFFPAPDLPFIQYLLPPYYYLNALYKPQFIGYMAIYALVIYAFDALIYRLRTR